jgi:hypothetical protein
MRRVNVTRDTEPASKRARVAKAQAQWSNSTVTSEGQFIPLTPENENEKASEPGTTKYNRDYSDTPEDEGTGPSEVRESSEYSPVSVTWNQSSSGSRRKICS